MVGVSKKANVNCMSGKDTNPGPLPSTLTSSVSDYIQGTLPAVALNI